MPNPILQTAVDWDEVSSDDDGDGGGDGGDDAVAQWGAAVPVPKAGPRPPREPRMSSGASRECSICMDQPNTHVLVPCGHKCICGDCAELVRVQGVCPICRAGLVWICEVYE